MLETLVVLYILLAFIFPFHLLAITLGIGTAWLIYRGDFLLKKQPINGKQLIWLLSIASVVNFLLSILVGGVMASLVFYIIYDNNYLFLFNFAFCSIISLRWFDFSHKIYEVQVAKIKRGSVAPARFRNVNGQGGDTIQPLFAVVVGLGKKTGMGAGMVPIFIDSGYLFIEEGELFFDGIFLRQLFDAATILEVEKVSSERIRITPKSEGKQFKADAYMVILRNRFYPFKSRGSRDKIFDDLSACLKIPSEGFHLPKDKDKMYEGLQDNSIT